MKKRLTKITTGIAGLLSSKYFLIFTIMLFALQSFWVALSFRFPMVFDELFHFKVIEIFTNHTTPLVLNQPLEYDAYSSFLFGSVSLYHYIMGFVLRFITIFTSSLFTQVIYLRVINLLLVTFGLYLYSKLFDAVGVKKIVSNVTIFIFSLVPLLSLVAATINYDNLIFMLTPAYLLLSVNTIKAKNKRATTRNLIGVTVTGLFASLIKFSFLPLFVGAFIGLLLMLFRGHHSQLPKYLWNGLKLQKIKFIVIGLSAVILLSGLFSVRYLLSIYRYGTPVPSCAVTLGVERCSANPVFSQEMKDQRTKDQRNVVPVQDYVVDWVQLMGSGYTATAVNTTANKIESAASPIVYRASAIITGYLVIAITLYQFKSIKELHSREWFLILSAVISLIVATFLFNAMTYYDMHSNMNVQSRYMLPIALPVMVIGAVAVNKAMGGRRSLKLILLAGFVIVSTQGSGAALHINKSSQSWYWQKPKILKTNQFIKNITDPLYIDN